MGVRKEKRGRVRRPAASGEPPTGDGGSEFGTGDTESDIAASDTAADDCLSRDLSNIMNDRRPLRLASK